MSSKNEKKTKSNNNKNVDVENEPTAHADEKTKQMKLAWIGTIEWTNDRMKWARRAKEWDEKEKMYKFKKTYYSLFVINYVKSK